MKRLTCLLLALIFVLSFTSACGGDGQGETSDDLELIVATPNEPTSLNKYNANDNFSNVYTSMIYSGLFNFDENEQLVLELAESYEFLDETTLRFKLRQDVTWHNGDPFTADDVLYSLQTARNSSYITTINSIDPDNISVVDEYTIDVGLYYYDSSLIYNLGGLGIMHRASTEGVDPAEYDANPVGTGAFKLVEWVEGDHLTFEVNQDYFKGATQEYKRIVFRIIDDASTRAIELETGSCDIAVGLSTNDAARLEDDSEVSVYTESLGQHYFISFNCQKEPFNNAKVREAICHAIDAAAIRQAVWEGFAEECGSPCMAPGINGYYDCGGDYEYDPDYAKQCLAEAGYADGFSVTIVAASQPVICEMVQYQLAQIGIDVTINNTDRATWVSELVSGNHEMYVGGWTNGTGDAAYSMQAFYSENFGGGGNRSFYNNPDLDALIDRAVSEKDEATRLELFKECQIMVYDDFVYAPLYVGLQLHASKSDISHYVIRSDFEPLYELLEVDR